MGRHTGKQRELRSPCAEWGPQFPLLSSVPAFVFTAASPHPMILKMEAVYSCETSVAISTVSQPRRPLNIQYSCHWQKIIAFYVALHPMHSITNFCLLIGSLLILQLWFVPVLASLDLRHPVLSICFPCNQRYCSLCHSFLWGLFLCSEFYLSSPFFLVSTSSLAEWRLPLKAIVSVIDFMVYKWLWFLLGLPGLTHLSWVTCGSTLLRPNLKMGNQMFICSWWWCDVCGTP
jgi:hypothetical protein